jgi:hypothetical protein
MPTSDLPRKLAPRPLRYGALPSPPSAGRANLAIQQVLAAAHLLADEGYGDQAKLLRAVVCDYQEAAAKRQYRGTA